METLEDLDHIPAVAAAVRKARHRSAAERRWTVEAHERGQDEPRAMRLGSYTQGRTLALELSELGYVVTVRDPEERVRLQMWPPLVT
jgi:hypothetical protein